MKVLLAGYNIDKNTLDELNKDKQILTPETISAAYARISRDPRPINELREISRHEIQKARKSNENIVYGMGHSSIAEHSVFNIDIIGVSRYLVEMIESHRLCSFTEKSQRYIAIDDDYIIPDELIGTRCQKIFIETIKAQNEAYHEFYYKLKKYYIDQNPEMSKNDEIKFDNMAKEDARYILSMSTTSQIGMTANARNLELMIRRCRCSKLMEAKNFANKLFEISNEIAPSLIKYTIPTEYEICQESRKFKNDYKFDIDKNIDDVDYVSLIKNDSDDFLTQIFKYSMNNYYPFKLMIDKEVRSNDECIKELLENLEVHDTISRYFEMLNLTFDICMSSSCFAQFKRHRMMTILPFKYDIYNGYKIPKSIIDCGLYDKFYKIILKTNAAYKMIKNDFDENVATYVLTNAHRRRVLVNINVRELYAMSRLRMDEHAQWEIRDVVSNMVRLAKKNMPITMSLACGKSQFDEVIKGDEYNNEN